MEQIIFATSIAIAIIKLDYIQNNSTELQNFGLTIMAIATTNLLFVSAQ